jgi:hypothetical protein
MCLAEVEQDEVQLSQVAETLRAVHMAHQELGPMDTWRDDVRKLGEDTSMAAVHAYAVHLGSSVAAMVVPVPNLLQCMEERDRT